MSISSHICFFLYRRSIAAARWAVPILSSARIWRQKKTRQYFSPRRSSTKELDCSLRWKVKDIPFFMYYFSLHILVVNALFFATLHSCFKGKSYRNASNVVQLHMTHFSLSIRHTSTSIPLSIAWPRFILFKPLSWCYLSIFKYFISIVTQLSLLISVRGYRLLPTVSHFYVIINHVVTRLS